MRMFHWFNDAQSLTCKQETFYPFSSECRNSNLNQMENVSLSGFLRIITQRKQNVFVRARD